MQLFWYAIKTYSGRETQVRDSLQKRISRDRMESWFGQLLVPTVKAAKQCDDQLHESTRKLFPGYVLLQMVISEKTLQFVKSDTNVIGFVGCKDNPTPIVDNEMKTILSCIQDDTSKPQPRILYDLDDDSL